MDKTRLASALSNYLEPKLSAELVEDFIKIRQDHATKTLERSSPGKFVETLVQCLQHLDTGKYEGKPNVDSYLDTKAEHSKLPEGLRICIPRVARAIYTLRNKRNIAHKNGVDSNTFDLAFVHQGASWILAELFRNASGITMQEAGALIEVVQAPVGTLVEEIEGIRLVHADVSVQTELLLLLHSHYPDTLPMKGILTSLSRRSEGAVRNRLRDLHKNKMVHGDAKTGYRLTQAGHTSATSEINNLQNQ
jgi:hypothetical protein